MLILNRAPIIETPIAELVPRAFATSVARSVTIYDSPYVALAEQRDSGFVTADARLIQRLSANATLGRRIIRVRDVTA
jgi:predicted nucleic acid-binding protein